MRVLMIGLSHRNAPLELRERVAVSAQALPGLLRNLRGESQQTEAVVLSTCNRTEIYIARPTHEKPDADDLRQLLAQHADVALDKLTAVTIQREQDRAALHLFRVVSGLDSMVLGEPQILGQVKRAYESAIEHQAVGPVLHKLFQDAIKAAKRVRYETGIGEGRLSIGSVAVDFARRVFDRFDDKNIVALGAGEMAKVTLQHLRSLTPGKLWVVNRSPQRALELASQLAITGEQGGARPIEDLDALLVEADILITSTGSPQPILTVERFTPVIRRRRRRSLFILDLAVPRDVDQAVASLANVYLYNVDDLQTVIASNLEGRSAEMDACEHQLAEAVGRCMMAIQHRDIGQLIRQLRSRLHDIGEQEMQRTSRKIESIVDNDDSEQLRHIIEEHTQRVINKILHLPLSQIDQRDTEAPLGFYAAALRRLFDLEEHITTIEQAPKIAQAMIKDLNQV